MKAKKIGSVGLRIRALDGFIIVFDLFKRDESIFVFYHGAEFHQGKSGECFTSECGRKLWR